MNAIATGLHTELWEEKNKMLKEKIKQQKAAKKMSINEKIRALYGAELGHIPPARPQRRTKRKGVNLSLKGVSGATAGY